MAKVKGITGKDLPMDEAIYNDTPNIGKKGFTLNNFRTGMYADEPEEAQRRLRKAAGITEDEFAAAKREWEREDNYRKAFQTKI